MLNEYKPFQEHFQQHLQAFLREYAKQPETLYAPFRYIFSLGGKQVRPLLVYIANDMFNGKPEYAADAALAVEIFHNFSLVHDDIMDHAPLRRGRETVHKKWNGSTAILSGDALLVAAYTQLEKYPAEKALQLMRLFSRTALEVCEGQQIDMDFEVQEEVTLEEYLQMIRKKTAVLLACSLAMGAYAANAPESEAKKMYAIGIEAGLAFQIQDDLLDTFGASPQTGKQTGGDILSHKKTWLALKALEDILSHEKQKVKNLLAAKHLPDVEKVEQVKNIYRQLDIPEKAENAIQHHTEKAIELIRHLDAASSKKTLFTNFFTQLILRKS